jgi:peroxiredoxin
LGALLAANSSAKSESSGGKVPDFTLKDHLGVSHELYRQTDARAIVVMFATTGCPIVQKSIPKIKTLRDQFERKGVRFWLINANSDDETNAIAEEARDFKIDVPILLDNRQSVARLLNATRTAEIICIRPETWTVFYRGAIDDQLGYGTERKEGVHAYLANALSNFLSGKKISPSRTDFKGCRIQFDSREGTR